jgi:hypothetical protein
MHLKLKTQYGITARFSLITFSARTMSWPNYYQRVFSSQGESHGEICKGSSIPHCILSRDFLISIFINEHRCSPLAQTSVPTSHSISVLFSMEIMLW